VKTEMAIQSKSESVRLPNQKPVCSFALDENNGKPFSEAFYSVLSDRRVFEEYCRRNEIERIVENGRERESWKMRTSERTSIAARLNCRYSWGQKSTAVSTVIR